jgi:hypothetical protein
LTKSTSTELVLFPDSVNLPSPKEFGEQLRLRLAQDIAARREERGDVLSEADVFALVRDLQAYKERTADYARALSSAGTVAGQEMLEELLSVPGKEQDGVATGPMTVPDLDGTDIKFTLNTPNEHTIDDDAVMPAVAAVVMEESNLLDGIMQLAMVHLVDVDNQGAAKAQMEELLGGALIAAQQRAVSLGSFSLQVSKVKAFAKLLASRGDDALSAVVSASITTVKVMRGVNVKREERK